MTYFDYADAPYPIRADIGAAHRRFWQRLAGPGAWWTGPERVAIARETRNAPTCALCRRRRAALSPYGAAAGRDNQHDHGPGLDALAVDAVHRIVTDQARISGSWVRDLAERGLSNGAYVELAGIVVAVFSIDEFHRALGLEPEALPDPRDGDISRYVPARLSDDIGFVPTIPPDGSIGNEADLWPPGRTANVVRALSLVPDAVRDWINLSNAQYLSFQEMANFTQNRDRAIDRKQIELIAGRVSSYNECFY